MRADSLQSSPVMRYAGRRDGARRTRAVVVLAAAAGLALVLVLTLEMAGLLAPLPTPQRVLAHMRQSWAHLEGYQAVIGFGRWGATHSPDGGSQQWFTRGAPVIEMNHDPYGFTRVERWGRDE